MKINPALSILSCGLLLHTSAHGAVTLLTDNFDSYPDGNLAGNGAWTAHSGAGSVPVQVTSGVASLSHGSGSREDVNAAFAAQTTGIVTATFDLTVTDDPFGSGTDYEYFTHLGTGTSTFLGRMDIQAPTDGGDYTIGIASSSSTAETTYTIDFTFGVAYTVSLSFDLDLGMGSVSIDGNTISSTSAVTGQTIDAFYLRQSGSSNSESISIDNLTVVTSIPEPTTALLGGLGLLALFRRRRA